VRSRSGESRFSEVFPLAQTGMRHSGNTASVLHSCRHPPEHGWSALRLWSFVRHVRGDSQWLQCLHSEGTDVFERSLTGCEEGLSHVTFLGSHFKTIFAEVLRGGRHVETLEAQEHRPFSWSNPRSSPTRFGLDAGSGSDRVPHYPSQEKSARSRMFPSSYL